MAGTKAKAEGYPPTPNCDRAAEVKDESQAIGTFLDWLGQQGIVLMRWETVVHEDPCRAHKKSTQREALEEIVALEAEFRGSEETITIPEDAHPSTCKCGGTKVITWQEEGWQRALKHGGDAGIRRILAEYYEVDYDAMQKEQDAVLKWLREQNDG